MGARSLTWLLGDTSDLIQATLDDLGLMRSVIQEIDMASKPIEDHATQVAPCDVRRATCDV